MIPLAKTFPEIFERSMIQYLKLKVTECSGCRLKVRSNMCSPWEGGGGGTPRNSWWGCRVQPGSPNPDPILDQKVLLSAPVFRPVLLGGNYIIITQIGTQRNKFFKSISNSHISLSFLLVWN